MSPSTARFFKQDIKIARQYNQGKRKGPTFESPYECDVGKEILREWVDANGLSAEQILSNESAASKVIQEHTLADIMADVQSDQIFQTVKRGSVSIAPSAPDVMVQFSPKVHTIATAYRRKSSSLFATNGHKSDSLSNKYNSSIVDFSSKHSTQLVDLNNPPEEAKVLRKKLLHSEHLPYSVWPKARSNSLIPNPSGYIEQPYSNSFTYNTVQLNQPESTTKYRRMSKSALQCYQEEIKNQQDNSREAKQ